MAATNICLPMSVYTPAQEAADAAALAALDPTNPLITMISDFGAMRAADRACLSSQGTAK